MKRWTPRLEPTKKEQFILKRLQRTRRLFAFLRLHRHELFDSNFQAKLEGMYRQPGAGADPIPPAQLCMVLLLQAYLGTSDAEAVELALMDARWGMVLDCLGAEEPPISQGAIQQFRERLIHNDMDGLLLERTIDLAKKTKGFDWKKLPKDLRVAIDSRPFDGAGRVEDTFNLLGHAARKIAQLAAGLTERTVEEVCRLAKAPLLLHSSIKAGLDINWSDPEQKDDALQTLVRQVTSLNDWLERERLVMEEPLRPYIEAIAQVQKQDLEKAKDGRVKIRRGVAEDRRISVEDPDMRHGRKSKSKRFNGFKQHIASDLDTALIIACAVTPANRPEDEALPELKLAIDRHKKKIRELSIDRAYVNSTLVADVIASGGTVIAKPWAMRNIKSPDLYSKAHFKIDMRSQTITCPADQVQAFDEGETVEFDPEICGPCSLRGKCTQSASGRGRTVHIAADERLQHRLRKLQSSKAGREQLRQRTGIEHRLAHIAARQGPTARYRGTRKNLFDLRRTAAIQNLETIRRVSAAA